MVLVLSFSCENFLVISGFSGWLLEDLGVLAEVTMVVLLFWALGRYLAEVVPEPREADSALGFETETPYTSFLY